MGSSQVMGPRGASTGDLELPAPSIIPVAYVLYSNKMEFDTKTIKKSKELFCVSYSGKKMFIFKGFFL